MTRNRIRVVLACALFALPAAMVVGADAPNPTGRPKQFEKGKHTTFAVWESDGVWHLRTSAKTPAKGKTQRVRFSGTVTVNGDKILSGEFQGLEKKPKAKEADFVYVYPNARSFDFQFSTESTNVDGLTFKVGPKAESVTFKLLTAGDDDPKRVMVGAKGVHPAKAEFTIPVPQPK